MQESRPKIESRKRGTRGHYPSSERWSSAVITQAGPPVPRVELFAHLAVVRRLINANPAAGHEKTAVVYRIQGREIVSIGTIILIILIIALLGGFSGIGGGPFYGTGYYGGGGLGLVVVILLILVLLGRI
jgi:hypothetical protein